MSEATEKSVLRIRTSSGSGTGFLVKGTKYIVTNYHVVQGFHKVSVGYRNEIESANVVLVVPSKDLAFLKINNPNDILGFEMMPKVAIKKQDRVSAMGYPLGMPFSITEGIVSSEGQQLGSLKYIQIDTAVNPGNSGGPLVDATGKVIGIVTCKLPEAENMGYALPSDWIYEELKDLEKNPPTSYTVRCTSCSAKFSEYVEHCESCGAELQASYFNEFPKSPLANFVEAALAQKNIDPIAARAGRDFWEFHSGSAMVRIFNYNGEHLIATSPLVDLPTSNIDKVLNFILEYDHPPYFLSLSKNGVFLSFRLHMSDVADESRTAKLQEKLATFLQKADDLDNQLVSDFGCTPSLESGITSN